jgi:hypothetical protein
VPEAGSRPVLPLGPATASTTGAALCCFSAGVCVVEQADIASAASIANSDCFFIFDSIRF